MFDIPASMPGIFLNIYCWDYIYGRRNVDRVAETTSEVSGSSPQEQKHVAMLKGWDDETEGTDMVRGQRKSACTAAVVILLNFVHFNLQPCTETNSELDFIEKN